MVNIRNIKHLFNAITIVLLLVFLAFQNIVYSQYHQQSYSQGYQLGVNYGQMFQAPVLTPLAPLPRLGENNNQAMAIRGLIDGLENNSGAFITSYTRPQVKTQSSQSLSINIADYSNTIYRIEKELSRLLTNKDFDSYLLYYEILLASKVGISHNFHYYASIIYKGQWDKDRSRVELINKAIQSAKIASSKGGKGFRENLSILKNNKREYLKK